MRVSDETTGLIPSTIKLNSSDNIHNKNTIDISGSDTETSPRKLIPCFSENDKRPFKDLNSNITAIDIHKQSNSVDLTRKSKKKRKLKSLTVDDLKLEYIKQRKLRKRDKKRYKRMSQHLHDTITKSADNYEDQLRQNDIELKQEYEAKLIEAEIKHNKSSQKITALNAEVQRLKRLLMYRHSYQYTYDMHSSNLSNRSTLTLSTQSPLEPLVCNETIELLQYDSSMEEKLKITMLPTLEYNQESVGSSPNGGEFDESNLVVFDGYNTYQNNLESDCETPRLPDMKRKKKKKKPKEKKSFFDFLVKCVTPSMCDQQL